jgi:hypothetical protein
MRPFTKAVFEKEGKQLVGSNWTQAQVQQVYEKADDLLDVLAESRRDRDNQRTGLRLAMRIIAMNVSADKADRRQLTLGVLSHLLEKGLYVAAHAANVYRNAPDVFKRDYATSKPAFMKDRFLRRQFPVSSFEAFRTQENPAICQVPHLSMKYAEVYTDSYHSRALDTGIEGYPVCSGYAEAAKLVHETKWIQAQMNRKDFLAEPTNRNDVKEVVAARMSVARE